MKIKHQKPLRADLCSDEECTGVYYILNTMSNRMRIGQSVHMYGRMFEHYGQLQSGSHTNKALQEDWIAFGEYNFEFGALVILPDHFYVGYEDRHLLDLEQHFMKLYRTKDPIYGYDFETRVKKQKKEYIGFFAYTSRHADQEIARTLEGTQP